jgi:hypothetical protein
MPREQALAGRLVSEMAGVRHFADLLGGLPHGGPGAELHEE